jgi:hypothetical protein
MRFRIRHLSGSKAGQEQIVEGNAIRIGRDPSCHVIFDPHQDDRVSANHAQVLVLDNGQVQLSDLGSSNGTYVGEQKISAPVPIHSGALVTFGDGGPQVSVIFEAPTAELPAVPAPPPKKSKKKLIIGIVVGVLLLVGIGVAVSMSGGDEAAVEDGGEDLVDDTGADDGTGELPGLDGDEEPTPEPKDEPKEEPKTEEAKNPWAEFGVGTTFEFKTNMEMMMGDKPFKTETTGKHILKAKSDEFATVLYETVAGGQTTGVEQKIPLKPLATEGEAPEVLEEKETKITVGAGEFSCTYRKIKTVSAGQDYITEMWIDPKLPAAYKTITKGGTTTTTTEMTAMDKK